MCIRMLEIADKSYERRKAAAMGIQQDVRRAQTEGDIEAIQNTIRCLVADFVEAEDPNFRKGGLIGLAAIAIALKEDAQPFLPHLLPPVLLLLSDHDCRVRYYACESLYNVAKSARRGIAPYMGLLYHGLCLLYADIDIDVCNGAAILDKLLRSAVSQHLEALDQCVPVILSHLCLETASIRMLNTSWLLLVDALNTTMLLRHIPTLVQRLVAMLQDSNRIVRQRSDTTLMYFQRKLLNLSEEEVATLDSSWFNELVIVLLDLAAPGARQTVFSRIVALQWVEKVLLRFTDFRVEDVPHYIDTVLSCLTDEDPTLRLQAIALHRLLVGNRVHSKSARRTVHAVEPHLLASDATVVLKALECLESLALSTISLYPNPIRQCKSALIVLLGHANNQVRQSALDILCGLGSDPTYFDTVLHDTLQSLYTRQLLEAVAPATISHLARTFGADHLYARIACLCTKEDTQLAVQWVKVLTFCILTDDSIRHPLLSNMDKSLFDTLYACWVIDAISVISLCLLCREYSLTTVLLGSLALVPITQGFMIDLQRLVDAFEGPAFKALQRDIMDPRDRYSALRAMYGVVLMLPQAERLQSLQHRLDVARACTPGAVVSPHAEAGTRTRAALFLERRTGGNLWSEMEGS